MTISTTTLKNAARAIECDLWTDPSGANYLCKDGAILRRWEPETSNADAFELMAILKLDIAWKEESTYVESFNTRNCLARSQIRELYYPDSMQALRLAIVRAASEIGESLCQ